MQIEEAKGQPRSRESGAGIDSRVTDDPYTPFLAALTTRALAQRFEGRALKAGATVCALGWVVSLPLSFLLNLVVLDDRFVKAWEIPEVLWGFASPVWWGTLVWFLLRQRQVNVVVVCYHFHLLFSSLTL